MKFTRTEVEFLNGYIEIWEIIVAVLICRDEVIVKKKPVASFSFYEK